MVTLPSVSGAMSLLEAPVTVPQSKPKPRNCKAKHKKKQQKLFPFFDLPEHLRMWICELVFVRTVCYVNGSHALPGVLAASRYFRSEWSPVFYAHVKFVIYVDSWTQVRAWLSRVRPDVVAMMQSIECRRIGRVMALTREAFEKQGREAWERSSSRAWERYLRDPELARADDAKGAVPLREGVIKVKWWDQGIGPDGKDVGFGWSGEMCKTCGDGEGITGAAEATKVSSPGKMGILSAVKGKMAVQIRG
jgi:hypothetical protein